MGILRARRGLAAANVRHANRCMLLIQGVERSQALPIFQDVSLERQLRCRLYQSAESLQSYSQRRAYSGVWLRRSRPLRLEFAQPVAGKMPERRMLRDSGEKAKMKLISEANKAGHPGLLKKIQNTVLLGGLGMLIPCTAVFAQAPDNSKTNQQTRGSETAGQQSENQGDRDLARKIRKSIIDDKNLSTYAHNMKVIARGGTVTLKGPVRSEDEKTAIEAKAVEIAGAANVKNELTVKSKTEN